MLAQLVAVVLGLDTLGRTLGYLFVARVGAGATAGGRSDVAGMAEALGGPYWLWGGLVALAALALLAGGLWVAVRGEATVDVPAHLPAPAPEAPVPAREGTPLSK